MVPVFERHLELSGISCTGWRIWHSQPEFIPVGLYPFVLEPALSLGGHKSLLSLPPLSIYRQQPCPSQLLIQQKALLKAPLQPQTPVANAEPTPRPCWGPFPASPPSQRVWGEPLGWVGWEGAEGAVTSSLLVREEQMPSYNPIPQLQITGG